MDAENMLDVHRCERPDEQFAACHHCHAEVPLQFVSPTVVQTAVRDGRQSTKCVLTYEMRLLPQVGATP